LERQSQRDQKTKGAGPYIPPQGLAAWVFSTLLSEMDEGSDYMHISTGRILN
jgi:hypothetical protein